MSHKRKVVVLGVKHDMTLFISTLRELTDDGAAVELLDMDKPEEAERGIVDCEAALVPLAVVDAAMLGRMKRCRLVIKMGIGYDNIDAEAAARLGIMVANIPDYCQGEVADHAMALFLALNRRVVLADRQVRGGVWNDRILAEAHTPRLGGKKFGLLGCGFIARNTATRARAFGMETIGYDPFVKAEDLAGCGIRKIEDLDAFLGEADFISLHIPAMKENFGFINMERLKKMKRSCLLVNTARGAVVNEDDLCRALKEGIIAGAALDVQVHEPPRQPSPFNELDNVVLTPHIGYSSTDSDRALRIKAAEEIARALTGREILHWVNRKGFIPRQ